MRRDVSALVVRVNSEVEPHHLVELGLVVAHHSCKVGRIIKGRIVLSSWLSTVIRVAVDQGGNLGKSGHEIHAVLIGRLVILGLINSGLVRLGEL